MNYTETGIFQQQRVRIENLLPEIGIEQVRQEILSGLFQKDPFISSKFFYDETGSGLFEEITKLEEYYLTRIEKILLEQIAPELMNRNSSLEIIEFGSGDSSKISILLNTVEKKNLANLTYIPVDFSRSAIEKSARQLSERYPGLTIDGYVADFMHQIDLIPHSEKPRIICLLGSTIGNFSYKDAKNLVSELSKGILKNDSLLIGFDLVKPEEVLHKAYNDSLGITEQFNKNILKVVNEIIQSDFDRNVFDHLSFYNPENARIEMYLVANKDTDIVSPFVEKPLQFGKGDSIHTEYSHKYTMHAIQEIVQGTGLSVKNTCLDHEKWYALVEFERVN